MAEPDKWPSYVHSRCLWSELTQLHSNPSFGIHCQGFKHHSTSEEDERLCRLANGDLDDEDDGDDEDQTPEDERAAGESEREVSLPRLAGVSLSGQRTTPNPNPNPNPNPKLWTKLYMDIYGSQKRSIYRSNVRHLNVNCFLWYLAFGITNLRFHKASYLGVTKIRY